MRKSPPYAGRVIQSINEGYNNCLYLFIGANAWKKGSAFNMSQPTLLLPPYEDPGIYFWPVRNYDILIWGNLLPVEMII